MLAEEYEKKEQELQDEIINYLTEYIPIKVSQNIMDASPERKFIFDTYDNKIYVDKIMDRFEVEKKAAQYVGGDNIECNGITITERNKVSTQCTIYGGDIGDDDENRKLGSARIEAMRFIDRISNTANSQFILINPPTCSEKLNRSKPNVDSIITTLTPAGTTYKTSDQETFDLSNGRYSRSVEFVY
jgi:hypothetical protein